MWNGIVTPRLRRLALEYKKRFDGQDVDMYDDINYDAFSYIEFIILIKMALRKNVEIPDLFGGDEE